MLESERVAWRRKDTGAVKKWKEKSQPSYLQGRNELDNFLENDYETFFQISVFLAP